MTRHWIPFRYALFALFATIANLATQRGVFWFGENLKIFVLSVACGTIVGMLIKYVLDKFWIFNDANNSIGRNVKQFSLYSATGILTTALFWGIEASFWLIWKTNFMRELGAIIGLSIGYVIKYFLDMKYVFNGSKLIRTS